MATQRNSNGTANVPVAKPIEFETGVWNGLEFLKIHGPHKPLFLTKSTCISILDCLPQIRLLAAVVPVAPVAVPVAAVPTVPVKRKGTGRFQVAAVAPVSAREVAPVAPGEPAASLNDTLADLRRQLETALKASAAKK